MLECWAATYGMIGASVLHPLAGFGGGGVRVRLLYCLHHYSIAPTFHYSGATAQPSQ